MERKRKPLSMGDKIKVLQRQAICSWCGLKIGDGPVIWDHTEFFALDGSDSWENFTAIHPECNKLKTYGTHVPLSGDISKIAKVKRLLKEYEEHRATVQAKGNPVEERPSWPRSRWPKGRKIAKRVKRKPAPTA